MAYPRILNDHVLSYPLTRRCFRNRPRLFANSFSYTLRRHATISVAASKFRSTSKLGKNNLDLNPLKLPRRRLLYSPASVRPAFRSPPSFWESRPYILPLSVALVCGSCFVYMVWPRKDEEQIAHVQHIYRQNFTSSLNNFHEGRWWTLLTPTLMHGTPLHLAANMAGLLSFGTAVVKIFGPGAFVITWVGAGIFASAASLIEAELKQRKLNERKPVKENRLYAFLTRNNKVSGNDSGRERSSVGASGSIFGLFALFTCFAPQAKLNVILLPLGAPAWQMMLGTVGFSLAAIEYGWLPGLGHVAHLGGMAFGLLYYAGWALKRGRRIPRFR